MYSAFHDHRATVVCCFDYRLIGALPKKKEVFANWLPSLSIAGPVGIHPFQLDM